MKQLVFLTIALASIGFLLMISIESRKRQWFTNCVAKGNTPERCAVYWEFKQ